MDPVGILLEMLLPLPLVWAILFFGRRKMFPKDKSKDEKAKKPVTPLISGALAVGIFGRALVKSVGAIDNIGIFLFLILLSILGSFLMIYGCANYSFKKGHHWGWGLLGVFSLIGLVIVALFKNKESAEPNISPA